MAHSRMAGKIGGYLAYHESHRYQEKYAEMQTFTVLTVTLTRERATELQSALSPLIPRVARAAYRFIPFEDLTIDTLANMRAAA